MLMLMGQSFSERATIQHTAARIFKILLNASKMYAYNVFFFSQCDAYSIYAYPPVSMETWHYGLFLLCFSTYTSPFSNFNSLCEQIY